MGPSEPERVLLPLMAEFLEAQFVHHEPGGYLGLDAEPAGDSAVRIGYDDGLLVFCHRVLCELPDRSDTDLVPYLYFYICRSAKSVGFVVAAASNARMFAEVA